MHNDRVQPSRFELKYLLQQSTADRVRDFVRCYLALDEFGIGKPNDSYPVHSIYLDSDNLEIYWRTVNGDKNRFKLRLRYYSDHPATPVFFEIKRRMKDMILKERAAVKHEAVPLLLAGHFPSSEHLMTKQPGALVAAQKFCRLMTEMSATPRSHIRYQREAYVSDNDEVRVTLDRDVCSEAHLEPRIKVEMEKPVRAFAGKVVLEIKFTSRYPSWLRELVRMASVMQCGVPKYVASVTRIGHRRLGAHAEVLEEESLLSTYKPGDDLPAFVRDDKSIGR
jgi:hypothetical protein